MLKIVLLILVLVLFILSSIFSGSETAYTAISPAKVQHMVENEHRFARLIQKQTKRYNNTLASILIGNNIVNVLSSIIMSYLITKYVTDDDVLALVISTAIVTPIIVLFGEIAPKILAKSYPEIYLKTFCIFIEFVYWVTFIFAYPLGKLGKKALITNSEDEIKTMVDIAKTEGVLQSGESFLVQKALDLDSTKVSQHYIKLKDVVSMDYRTNIKQAIEVFKDTNYSRIPVTKNGEFIGIVLLKDLYYRERGKIVNYITTIPFISANSTLASGLEKIRKARAQMAFVVENNNSTEVMGIITIEDIIEELVGEIYDETDEKENIFKISLEKSHVQVDTKMKDVFKQLEFDDESISDEEWEMELGDWILLKAQRPRLTKNTRFVLENIAVFKVFELNKTKKEQSIIEIIRL
ncbi:CNNM domain-containing protein [Mycoplasma sp. Ms02]|uniref:CNNM domain-containing protein n=1 Tax=Mycoplasma sp. Ms02 TaxID=353851 RepID=UPI001C8AE0B1|nr:CNNM domain-containing protein [Mycoplasma sp. Ms02]QZE12364.1 CNNM domain-containing protein [Mycoplasma sp. Ms02]